ncbi:hypothetical protein [Litorihabitans aurantiacus]|uniref:Uncharacterized protein n=1 Tax=Litorihabitans aurantiacus TaxID=1930061 RepID=A0AA37UQQ0_9MICO|nr:hypothetical protein [Litorihabitans aurantiacus]GMA31196.1 hypothetical protein GCM10025875_11880 [Litorihabitans aurantiacus]
MEPLPRNQAVRTARPPTWFLAFASVFLLIGVGRLTLLAGGQGEPWLGLGNILIALLWVALYVRAYRMSRRPTRGPDPHGGTDAPRTAPRHGRG